MQQQVRQSDCRATTLFGVKVVSTPVPSVLGSGAVCQHQTRVLLLLLLLQIDG